MTKRKRPRKNRRRAPRAAVRPVLPRIQAALEVLLHPRATDRPWKYLPLVLALAFAARAVVALSGDFVLHPDEIMQYLEPAHRLVFGSGVTYWEYFYGARSWLVPGTVAGVLMLFDAVGLGQPFWYVGGVKLLFCAISLTIPAGMYVFARRHFGETAGRAALLAGAFWYELTGFAHKPMTEFVATAPLVALLALCVRRSVDDARTVWTAAFLAGLTAAIRLQYAPLPSCCWGSCFCVPGRGFSSHWLPPGSPPPSACSTLSCGTAACSTPTSPTSATTSFSVRCVPVRVRPTSSSCGSLSRAWD